jgi:TP901 family phage tail tape measure protein
VADEQIVTSIVAKADLSSLVSEVHRASASLQQLQRELLASNKAISSSTKLANNLFRDTLTGSGQFSSHFVNLNSDVDKFGKNLDAGRLKLKNYFSTFREHATTQKGMIRELAKEQVMLQNSVLQPLGRNAQGLMQYNVMIPRGLDAIANKGKLARMEMQIMNRALSEGAGSLINFGKNTQWAGRQLTVGLTVPITMFGAAASKAFREADTELVRLTKVYGGLAATSAADLKAIREEVVQTAKTLSKTMGASFKDTIALGADIAATGQTGNELLGSIAETTRLSILGEVDRQDAMKATLSIQTAFKQNTQQLTESINFLNAVENQTSTTLNDLVEAIPKAGPVIQQLGGSVKDLALYLTAMREGGISASEGANALKSGLASLINPTKQTVGMMSDFGIDVMGMVAKNTGNTTGLLLDLQGALDKLDPLSKARAMEQMFGKFQFARMSALLNNLGKEGSQTLQVLNLMKASTADLAAVASRELKMVTESASGKYKRAIEGLKAELADVGEEFLGVATKLVTAASKILDFFTSLPAPIKKALTFLAGFTAIVGPLIMLTGLLANFFGYITKGVVQLRAFFMKANGWKMLTPEIIAAQKAAEMVENAFYSDAAAAQVLHNALQKLVLDYQNLQSASMKSAVPVNGGMSTVSGNTVMAAGRRIVDPNDPYVGDPNTRAMSHINPRDPNKPATIFGGVPGAIPVNRGISRTPQMYMNDRLPNVEGLTSVKNISTGIVPAETAKFHALMATLGMQTEQEVAALKKTIAMGGTVSRELLDTFDDILPITQKFANSAAEQSALIVQQMRNAEITVEQAKARILALNAQIEADMGSAVSMYAAGKGRSLDLTKAPMMNQPVVDANGQFTLRDLYKKKANASVMEEFGRLRGVRTFGAPYSIQPTRMPKFNTGGDIESFGPTKTIVSGPSSINYDDRLGSVPVGGYVLNQGASMDPANAPLVAMASATYENGGEITAQLTPRETVFGPKIQRMPELYAAIDAANNGYNFGGQIMSGIAGYGKKTDKTPAASMDEKLFKKQYKEYLRFINNPRYEDDMRVRMIMLDAAELSYTAKMPMDKAIQKATSNFDAAKLSSGGSDEKFIAERIKQVKALERKYPALRVKNAKSAQTSSSKALNWNLNKVREAMIGDPRFAGVKDLIEGVKPTTFLNADGSPSIKDLHDRGHIRRRGTLGYMTSGYMGTAAVLPSAVNNIMSRLEGIGLSRDVLNLNGADARANFELALKRTGMDKFTTVDDLYAAVQDDGKFKSKEQISSGNVVRATKEQRNSLRMFLQAAAKRQRWAFLGRPPRPVLVAGAYNMGGMIPGGSISANRSSYGIPPLSPRLEALRLAQQAANAKKREADMIKYPWIKEAVAGRNKGSGGSPLLSLLAPDKQLKILQSAREMSRATATGSFKDMPPVKYGHMVAPSSGMSYPVPGVSGLYKDADGNLKFFKGVQNEMSAKAEIYGTRMAREVFGLESPEQTIRTILNPLDPSGKTKLLGLESPFDKRFAGGGTKFTDDEMIRQTIASLTMNNKDLSPSNVFGNVLADVGAAGVFPRASGNTEFAKTLPSMGEQGMINLLGVKGGARKDFAVNTAPLAGKMSAKQYERKMKKAMEQMYPKLVKFVAGIPKADRGPYVKLLKRFEDGMLNTDFAKLHSIHVAAKRNSGGPVGGSIQRGRYSYGKTGAQRPGNPAARAAWESEQRAQRERDAAATRSRAASHQVYGQQALTSGLGRQAVRTGTTSFYNPGQVMVNNMMDPFKHSAMMKARYLQAAFNTTANAATKGATSLAYGLMTSGTHIKQAYQEFGNKIMISGKAAMQKIKQSSMLSAIRAYPSGVRAEVGARLSQAYPGMYSVHPETNKVMNNMTNRPVGLMNAPGLIGRWSNSDQEGVQTRKVGSLGFRKTEYMVNNATTQGHTVPMTAAQARAAGVAVQRPGGMGMGAQMGIGMIGSMGGMALMQKEKINVMGKEMSGMTAGFGLMAASSIAPMLPWIKWFDKAKVGIAGLRGGFTGVMVVMKSATLIGEKLLNIVKGFGPVGLAITAVFEGFKIWKRVQDDWQDARMGLSMTAKAAEQAGIKYFNLQETMQGYLDKQKLLAAGAKGSAGNSIGMPGLPSSIEEMKKAKEEGKGLKDLIESLNRSGSTEETQRLVNNQKAQMVAAGMSIEEANKKIYGALANSKKSGQAYRLLADEGFGEIVDKSSAAEFAVGNLINTLKSGAGTADWHKEVGNGFEGLINVFQNSMTALVGTKDALGNVIDEYEAYQQIMSKTETNNPEINDPMGKAVYNNLVNTQPLLASITNEADSIKGVLAKWKLYTSGINIDLSKIDSTLAQKLAGFTAAIGTGISELTKAADSTTTYGRTGSALLKLQKIINATSAASQRAAAASQRSAQEELKVIAKKIKLIEDEKNKKLESLRATQDASNYALELQKLQIEYADAVSRGDQAGSARARLDIDQLTSNRQSELASKAIEDAANKAKAPLEKQATTIQEKSDKKTVAFQNAQDNSASSSETVATLTKFQTKYNDLTTRSLSSEALPEKDRKDAQSKITTELIALLKEVQTAGKGKSAGAVAVRESFADYFDKNGKPIALESTSVSYNGRDLSTTTTPLKSATDVFQKDLNAVSKLATSITGNVTIKQLRDDLLVALGKPNNPNVQSPVVIAKGEKNAGQYAGGSYMQLAQLKAVGAKPIGATRANPQGTYVGSKFTANGIDYQVTAEAGYMGFAVKKLHHGGSVIGAGNGTSDSIPAMLSNGEYVISAKAVQNAGVPMLDNINRMASGGMVRYNVPKMSSGGNVRYADGGLASSSSSMYNINVSLSGTNLTADDVAASIHKEMRLREMAAGINRKVGRP